MSQRFNPEKVLDEQISLLEWVDSPFGEGWADWYLDTTPGMKKVGRVTSDNRAKESTRLILQEVGTAETVYITKDMCDLIEHAAKQMPDMRLEPHMLFWQNAFIRFERPVMMEWDIAGDPQEVPVMGMTSLVSDVIDADHMEATGSIKFNKGVIHITLIDVDRTEGLTRDQVGIDLFPYDLSAWSFNKEWETVEEPEGESRETFVDAGLARQRKLLLATHLISAQKLAQVSGYKPSRGLRRRAERSGFATYGEIRVVTLRRHYVPSLEDKDSEHEDVEWSHRWVVKGHWRKQYYPSRDEHELIWIQPYVKGPQDKPLIIKDTVYNLKR